MPDRNLQASRIGKIVLPKVGANHGFYVVDLEEKGQHELFASERVIRIAGKSPTDFTDGQLVRYEVNEAVESLVKQIEPL
jgi:hypothetical protein